MNYDIVVYGATGFVGKLTAQYLARAGTGARIALAGRSIDKLRAVRDTLGDSAKDWPLLTADASQPSTLNAMAARTRVVVTTVGPYAKYGLPLVEACAAAGTDYADLTGKPRFIRKSIDEFHKQAVDTGARIVHSCGFDSIPSDLTVYALRRKAAEDGTGELTDTTLVVRRLPGAYPAAPSPRCSRSCATPPATPRCAACSPTPICSRPTGEPNPRSAPNPTCLCGAAATSRPNSTASGPLGS